MNRSADTYDENAVIQRKMAHRLLLDLKERIPDAEHILEWGCGTGYFTQLLADHYPRARITAVDLSDRMIESAREKVTPEGRIRFMVGDDEEGWLRESAPFDLICSCAALHWLENAEGTIHRWTEALAQGGWMVAAAYGPDTLSELHFLFRQVEEDLGVPMYRHGHHFPPARVWRERLEEAGLTDIGVSEWWHRLEFENCRHLLDSLKATGESYSEARHTPVVDRLVLERVMKKYNRAYRLRGKVYATWHVVQWSARKECYAHSLRLAHSSCNTMKPENFGWK
jgi:malonyl-CoA O-methyltransferase